MINVTKEPSDAHKNTLKEEILQETIEKFMEKILDIVNQNVQEALKKFQDTTNKEYEKTQKQINELIGILNKHQCETENTINREINELKMKTENIKDEVSYDMEKRIKQKQKTQWKVTPGD
jgi:5'-deoxynucleotidase YfbR-like HD superfamily hydrolase